LDALRELISRLHEFSETFKLVVEADSPLNSSSTIYLGLLRDIKEKFTDVDIWSERYQEGKIIFISGPRRFKLDAIKLLISKGERRRSVERRSPRRESPRRENSPRRAKQSSINITVPEALVARLIGKNGENIKNIMHKSSSNISFQKQEQPDIKTPDGGPARICTLKGTPNSIADGLKILLDQV
jgi:hypothetical protein